MDETRDIPEVSGEAAGDQGYREYLNSVLEGSTDETTPPAVPAEDAASPETPGGSTEPSPADPGNLRALLEAKKQAHPDQAEVIEAIYREFQAGLTPKLQEAAELRRKLDGLDDGVIDWVRHFRQTASYSKEAARQMLQEAMAELEGYGAPPPSTPDPFEELGYQSDVERALAAKVRELEQFMVQQQAVAHQAASERQFSSLASEWGEIPFEQRREVELRRVEMGLPPEMIPVLWKGMFGLDVAQRRAANTALTQQKAGLGPPPGNAVNRATVVAPDPNKMSFADYLRATVPD